MFRKMTDLIRFRLEARDGEIGRVKDFYFDDKDWAVRHVVADTGSWLSKLQVLISPFAITGIRDSDDVIEVNLTRQQIEQSPSIEEDKPVSRQMEEEYYGYYGWPYYWNGPHLWGPYSLPTRFMPTPLGPPPIRDEPRMGTTTKGNPSLRSSEEVRKYRIQALDDLFGHIEDFVFNDEDWAIRYFIVDTRNWWPGKKVLLPREWISSIDWLRSQIQVNLGRDTVKQAPAFDPDVPLTREYEEKLYAFFNREPYWLSSAGVHHV